MNLGFGYHRKAPELARLLSIIPGLGHLYIKDYFGGFIWFIISLIIISLNIFIPHLIFLICYIMLVIRIIPEASKKAAEYNARKSMQEEFSAEKKTKDKVFDLIKKEKLIK
ncbi:MAG: hypothetical protein ACE14V_04850 [bacterium]